MNRQCRWLLAASLLQLEQSACRFLRRDAPGNRSTSTPRKKVNDVDGVQAPPSGPTVCACCSRVLLPSNSTCWRGPTSNSSQRLCLLPHPSPPGPFWSRGCGRVLGIFLILLQTLVVCTRLPYPFPEYISYSGPDPQDKPLFSPLAFVIPLVLPLSALETLCASLINRYSLICTSHTINWSGVPFPRWQHKGNFLASRHSLHHTPNRCGPAAQSDPLRVKALGTRCTTVTSIRSSTPSTLFNLFLCLAALCKFSKPWLPLASRTPHARRPLQLHLDYRGALCSHAPSFWSDMYRERGNSNGRRSLPPLGRAFARPPR